MSGQTNEPVSDVIRELQELLDDEDATAPPWDPGFGYSIVGTANRKLAFAAVNALPALLAVVKAAENVLDNPGCWGGNTEWHHSRADLRDALAALKETT